MSNRRPAVDQVCQLAKRVPTRVVAKVHGAPAAATGDAAVDVRGDQDPAPAAARGAHPPGAGPTQVLPCPGELECHRALQAPAVAAAFDRHPLLSEHDRRSARFGQEVCGVEANAVFDE